MKNFSQKFFFHKQIYIVNSRINLADLVPEKEKNIYVDFFPEGGSLIASMNNKVGFKISNEGGNGEDKSGFN